jgi:hypothetical protein
MKFIGNCINSFDEFGDCVIPPLPFANVTEFAQLVEESDNIEIGDFVIQYDLIHTVEYNHQVHFLLFD